MQQSRGGVTAYDSQLTGPEELKKTRLPRPNISRSNEADDPRGVGVPRVCGAARFESPWSALTLRCSQSAFSVDDALETLHSMEDETASYGDAFKHSDGHMTKSKPSVLLAPSRLHLSEAECRRCVCQPGSLCIRYHRPVKGSSPVLLVQLCQPNKRKSSSS